MKKAISFLFIVCLYFSCKTQQNISGKEEYKVLNTVIEGVYTGETINLYRYCVVKNHESVKNNIKYMELHANIDKEWFVSFLPIKEQKSKNDFEKWDSNEINLKDLNTSFDLIDENTINKYKSLLSNSGSNEKEKYDIKISFWVRENAEFNIWYATKPIFNEDKSKAIIFLTFLNQGVTAWLLEKDSSRWVVIEKVGIASI
ncbi:hypothetical protein [Flagellimonas profundi]|uniref:Lipoprotein n=1 Tax=Flagellimonas profundi TaxID=2915620 RepID=A0ABS3FGD3_9FLAO|nr:hypothetical protein [Allomuricauda profundi]MBO0342128.1 hypothetical protein [Allomuricauda profundi]